MNEDLFKVTTVYAHFYSLLRRLSVLQIADHNQPA